MKSVIPFTKELEFNTKVSEITSISLERDFKLEEESIEGNLHITGEYKSHEVSVNVIPFSFKIPFSIAVSKNIKPDTLSLEISDFAYDMVEDEKIKVHIELELNFEEELVEEEEKEVVVDNSEELVDMLEERSIEEQERNSFEEQMLTEQIKEAEIEEIKEKTEDIKKETEEIKEETPIQLDEKELITKEETEEEYMNYHIHILKEGESLETLCAMYHVTGGFLSEYNDISNLEVGDKILIPIEDE